MSFGSYRFLGPDLNTTGGTLKFFGTSTASGDVTGDGRADLLIGGRGVDVTDVYLIDPAALVAADQADGSRDYSIDLTLTPGIAGSYRFTEPTTFTGFGQALTLADINADGVDDVVIGAPDSDHLFTNTGSVYIFDGASLATLDAQDGISDGVISAANATYTLHGENAGDQFGAALARVPHKFDNVDLFEGIAIGTPGYDGNAGFNHGGLWIVSGDDIDRIDGVDGTIDGEAVMTQSVAKPSPLNGTTWIVGAQSGERLGESLAWAPEIYDTAADFIHLLAGGTGANGGGGAGYFIVSGGLGTADFADGTTDGRIDAQFLVGAGGGYRFTGIPAPLQDYVGASIGVAGDVDGDGLADILIGATNSERGSANGGAVYLITSRGLSAADGADGTQDFNIDLGVAPGVTVGGTTAVYVLKGDIAGMELGDEVASVGDVDGDGLDDFLISASNYDEPGGFLADNGAVLLVTAAALTAGDAIDGTVDGEIDISNLPGLENSVLFFGNGPGAGSRLGLDLTVLGDIDGDGAPEVFVGAPQLELGAFDLRGGGYLVSGVEVLTLDALDGAQDGIVDVTFLQDTTTSVLVSGNASDDLLIGRNGNDTLIGLNGFDELQGRGGADSLLGGGNDDLLIGGNGNDTLLGGSGIDTIRGGNGKDSIEGGDGKDVVYMGNGDDIYIDNGQAGANGADWVQGNGGNDTIEGGGGNDRFEGQNGSDLLKGGDGNDKVFGGNQNDTLQGGNGNDTVAGGNGRDRAFMGNGNDSWFDNDQDLFGDDFVFGGAGNDTIRAGGGDDTLGGGGGSDLFILAANIDQDLLTDYSVGTDALHISAALWNGALTEARLTALADTSGADLVLNFDNGDSLTMAGLTATTGLLSDITLV